MDSELGGMKCSLRSERTRGKGIDDSRSRDASDELRYAIQDEPHRADDACNEERETDVGVEEPSGHAVEQPDGDEEAEPE